MIEMGWEGKTMTSEGGRKKSEAGEILQKQTTLNANGLIGISNEKLLKWLK